ncbi:MAG: hypothetical protein AAF573_02795 [Bacteroidota bacterium]
MNCNSILTFLFVLCVNSVPSSQKATQLSDLGLSIEQGERKIAIQSEHDTIILSKEKFSVSFNLEKDDDVAQKYHAVRMVADIDPEIFVQFETDKKFEEIPALALGTSLAGPRATPYKCIFFHDQAHHYIFYSSEAERRANLVAKENEQLRLSFDIENYCMQDLEVNIKDSNFEEIFLVFVFDKNLNETVEADEMVKIEIQLEEED